MKKLNSNAGSMIGFLLKTESGYRKNAYGFQIDETHIVSSAVSSLARKNFPENLGKKMFLFPCFLDVF